MIKVTVGNNLLRKDMIIDESRTIRSVLEEQGVDYVRGGTIHFDGSPLGPGDFDKSFTDFGVTRNCFLLQVTKADNGTNRRCAR